MMSDEEKTPAVVTLDAIASQAAALGIRRRPPPGRPPGALSISEIVERVTREARERADAELERVQQRLCAELREEVRTATGLGIAAIALNAVVVFVVLAVTHVLSGRVLAVVLAALVIFFVAFVMSLRSDLKDRLARRTLLRS
jgi:VIT1/CCC1 family predicted Fe2+/Mn2+ transporter